MNFLRTIWQWLRSLGQQRAMKQEIDEELRFHMEMRTADNIAAGMSPEEAARAARKRFGNVQSVREECRESRWGSFGATTLQDVRFGLRMLGKNPGFTTTAALTLAIGIGCVTTVFTIINGVGFRGLPFEDSRQIVSIAIPAAQLDDYARQQMSCENLAVARSVSANLSGDDMVTSRQPSGFVSWNFLDPLRVRPALGRAFRASDAIPGAEGVVLIGNSLWLQAFHGDATVLGRELRLNGEIHTVIGVMPPGFGFPRNESLWVPLADNAPDSGGVVFGRLKDGVTPRRAAEEFSVIAARLLPSSAGSRLPTAIEVVPFASRGIKPAIRNLMNAILGATFLVLLLACANVATLILARACERSREFAVRSAVGATRRRLIVQLLTESLLLSVLGAVAGTFVAHLGTQMMWKYLSGETDLTGGAPFWVNFDLDARVLLFVTAVTVFASVISGLIPALRASQVDVNEQLKDGRNGSLRLSRLTRQIVNVQMALSVALVVAAGLFLVVLLDANQKSLPYDPKAVMSARVLLNEKDYPTPTQRNLLFDELLEKLAASPGIEAAGATSSEMLRAADRQVEIEGESYPRAQDAPACRSESVTPGFFGALNLPLRDGRIFTASDTADSLSVAVVSVLFAEKFGRERNIVGRRFRVATSGKESPWLTIIGVVADAGSVKALNRTDGPRFYQPATQAAATGMTLLLRGRANVTGLADVIRRTVTTLDRDLPVDKIFPVQRIIEMERIGINLPALLCLVCGLGALALASVGVYGVISFSVKTRTRELGIRLALGASRRDIIRLIVGGGLRQISIGLGAGVVLALGVSAALSASFSGFGSSAYNVWVYVGVVALLAGVGAAALLIPALRASRVDPMIALRTE